MGIGILLGIHVLVLLGINSGLGRDLLKQAKAPIEALLLDEVKPDIPPPPPPPPPPQKQLPPPPEYIPPVEVRVQAAQPPVNAIAAVSNIERPVQPPSPVPMAPAAPVAPPVPAGPPVRVSPVINAAANCEKPDYPSLSRRQQEEGTVQLKFLIGLDGRVMESQVERPSGFRRLDEAARVALSKCQFKPGTVDGKPEQSWATVRYVWRLED